MSVRQLPRTSHQRRPELKPAANSPSEFQRAWIAAGRRHELDGAGSAVLLDARERVMALLERFRFRSTALMRRPRAGTGGRNGS